MLAFQKAQKKLNSKYKIKSTQSSSNKKHSNNKNKQLFIPFLRRYFRTLRITGGSVLISAFIHLLSTSLYYFTYLWLNPDDPGRKQFYSSTTASKGVNIGGKTLGGGGIHTNYHKSYLFHLIKNFYMNYAKTFCVQFSIVYLIALYFMGFFEERTKNDFESDNGIEAKLDSTSKLNPILRRRLLRKNKTTDIQEETEDSDVENEVFDKNL